MRPKFDKSRISMKEVIIFQFYKDLTRSTPFFEGWSWFKFNNLGLALVMALTLYISMTKRLTGKRKLKAKTVKLLGGPFCNTPPPTIPTIPPILNGVKNKY